LVAIARNRAIDYLRSGAVICCPDGDRLADREDVRLFGDMERDIRLSLGRPMLNSALQKLGATQRTAIGLAYFEGCTQSEIAKRTGHPLGTVKTWVRSALGVLREHLHAQTSNDFGIQPAYARTGSSAERTPLSGQ
jgi:RNA polymerase sigma-70 factor (ECF subfamily)